MDKQKFNSVWDALEDTAADSASMKARSEMMIILCEKIKSFRTTQAKAAQRLGITQPRLNDLLRGRIDRFSLDALFDLAARAEITVQMKFKDAA